MIRARLPVHFGGVADDAVGVFKGDDHGDGTTRTFRKHAAGAFASWRRGGLAEYPYAADDALVEQQFDDTGRNKAWLLLDPNDPKPCPASPRS